MMKKFRVLLAICLALLAHAVLAAPTFPELSDRVVDQAGLLSADVKQNIITKLENFEDESTMQVVVGIVNSLEDYEIRDYGYQLARHWELGQKDKNNGVLLLVAPNERKVSIEVGYGLEGSLTDALSFAIIQDHILPKFKQGDMGAGIELGVDMILQGLAGEITEQSIQQAVERDIDPIGMIFMLFFFGIIIFVIIQAIRNPGTGGSSTGDTTTTSWGRSGGSGFGGGGFSGGGGSFGGGGASGGW